MDIADIAGSDLRKVLIRRYKIAEYERTRRLAVPF